MNIRKLIPEEDFPTLREWWKEHGALEVPEMFLPHGFMAGDEDHDIAACFLYLDAYGKFSMVEYLTTNPAFSGTKKSLAAFKALLCHVEQLTAEMGCGAIFSMVAPGSSEERIMARLGFGTSEGPAHKMYGKALNKVEVPCP